MDGYNISRWKCLEKNRNLYNWSWLCTYTRVYRITQKLIIKPQAKYYIVVSFFTYITILFFFSLLWHLLFSHSFSVLLLFDRELEWVCASTSTCFVLWMCVCLWVILGFRVGKRREHSNPSGSGELSELIVLYHSWTEVQNWAELSTVRVRGWWSLCLLEPDRLRWRDVKSVQPATSQLEKNKPKQLKMQHKEFKGAS